jgi:hypothetical protein
VAILLSGTRVTDHSTAHSLLALNIPPALRFAVERWQLPVAPSGHDDDLVMAVGSDARFAVIDGLAPGRPDASPLGGDAGRYAAAIVRLALGDPGAVTTALTRATAHLHDPAIRFDRDQAAASAIVASVNRHRTEIVVAGAGAAFLRRDGFWTQVGSGRMLDAAAESAFREALSAADVVDADARSAFERSNPIPFDGWHTTPAGRFPTMKTEQVELDNDWDELVLATTGSRLDTSLLDDLADWLAGLRAWESSSAGRLGRHGAAVHDDATVLRIRRRPLSEPAVEPARLGT